jgi:hypothetical protein
MTVEAPAAPDERLPDDATASTAPGLAPDTAADAVAGAVRGEVVMAGVAGMSGVAGTSGVAGMSAVEAPAGMAPGATPLGVRALESGIIEVTLPPNQEIAGAEARVAGAAVRALADGRRVPVMLVITGVIGVSVEARQVYVSSIAASAFALVGETPVDRVIAHYLLRSRTETIPAQFFTSEAEALEWLGQYASEH